nr:V-type ATPase 116kDa subunit family protein [Deinococcus pimensis]
MQQVVLVGRRRDNKAVIAALQDAGVLHIVPITEGPLSTGSLTGAEAEARRTTERLLARADGTLAELGAYRTTTAPLPDQGEWERVIEAAAAPASTLAKRITDLGVDLDTTGTYGGVVRALANLAGGLDRSRRLALLPFTLGRGESADTVRAALEADLTGRYALDTTTAETGAGGVVTTGIVAVLTEDRDRARAALGKARTGELRLPGRFDGLRLSEAAAEMDRLARGGREELDRLERERRELAAAHAPVLYAVRDALADEVAIYDVQSLAARGKYSLALQGYVPVDRVPALRAALERFGAGVSYELHDADEHHDENVPVQLKNNSYSANFEPLLGLLSPPRYGTFDPTWVMSVFFPLFFGFIVADFGFGALFLLGGLWFLGRARRGEGLNIGFMNAFVAPDMMRKLGVVITTMSIWSIIWGFLTGEMFGNLAEHLGWFHLPEWALKASEATEHHTGGLPILFPRLATAFANTALIVTLAVGVFMVLWAWMIRAQIAMKHGDRGHFWEAIGMLGGLSGLVSLAIISEAGRNLTNGAIYSDFSNPLLWLMYIGFAVFVLGLILSKVPLMIIELLSQGGNIVSFARLFAVGVAAAILANLATDLGWGMYERFGIIGILIGVILGLLVHAFALALTIIGHVLQPLRLHFVEFLNPTGFHNETSPVYNPLRRLSSAAGSKK